MDSHWLARAIYHLEGWGEWRRRNRGSIARGYPSSSTCLSSGGVSKEFDHMVEAEDARAAAICDAVIDDLTTLYRAVLESEHIMQGAFKCNRAETKELLLDAQMAFWDKAKKHLT